MTSSPGIDGPELARQVEAALDDGKAVDIRVIDVSGVTVITDYMIVASGRSSRQVKALAERVRETAGRHGVDIIGMEGANDAEWVLIDLGDVVAHIMQPEVREFYQLEKLWDSRMHEEPTTIERGG